jgi:hypothetical protein
MNKQSETHRETKEKKILAFLQHRQKAKTLSKAIKSDELKGKPAARNMVCTFCRNLILKGAPYFSFKSQGQVVYKGKALRTERMHEPCLNRYLRPGVSSLFPAG